MRRNHSTSAHHRLLALQKRIFRSLNAEADQLLGVTPPAIQDYERESDSDLAGYSKKLRASNKDQLIEAIRGSDVSLIADYHTFTQAQRTALRLIRDAIREGEKWMVGLELIPSHFQSALDDFQAGKMPLEEFHQTIHYEDEWGFPWKNYAPIFDWAREHGVRLIALNRPRELSRSSASLRRIRTDSELHDRDEWAAGIITDLFSTANESGGLRLIVLYGELHIASKHLPAKLQKISKSYLKKPLKCLRVYQNVDRIYWHLAAQSKEHRTPVLKLGAGGYCVLSSTPWAKLQSLVSWAEGGNISRGGFDTDNNDNKADDGESLGEDDESSSTDYLSVMSTYGTMIAEFLGVTAPSFASLSVKTIDEADFLESLEGFSRQELSLIRTHVYENQRLYIPRANVAYLGTPSQNGAAELAAVHLYRVRTRSTALYEARTEDFFRIAIESAFGFFGSLIVNPKRKCDLAQDHMRKLKLLKSVRSKAKSKAKFKPSSKKPGIEAESQARELTLALLRWEKQQLRKRHSRIRPTRPISIALGDRGSAGAIVLAARYLGRIVGKRLYQAVLNGSLQPEKVRHLCLSRVAESSEKEEDAHERRWIQLLEALTPAPAGESKEETL